MDIEDLILPTSTKFLQNRPGKQREWFIEGRPHGVERITETIKFNEVNFQEKDSEGYPRTLEKVS